MNRKRLKYFNKILDPHNKQQRFRHQDFEIYEPKRETLEDTWKKSKEKLTKARIVPMTEEEKKELELNQLSEKAYYANLAGQSLDNIINFQSKTPDKWMDKWKKNLQINPKFISTVVDNENTEKFTGNDVKKIIKEIKNNIKKDQLKRQKKLSLIQQAPSNDDSIVRKSTFKTSIASSLGNTQKSMPIKKVKESRTRAPSSDSIRIGNGQFQASDGNITIVDDNFMTIDKRGSHEYAYKTPD